MDHKRMYKGSPYYAAAYDRYGRSVPESAAEKIAHDHGTTLSALREAGEALKVSNGCIKTLELILSLGY